eukprot:6174262-Pleurochrysis_carterae.AAC.2
MESDAHDACNTRGASGRDGGPFIIPAGCFPRKLAGGGGGGRVPVACTSHAMTGVPNFAVSADLAPTSGFCGVAEGEKVTDRRKKNLLSPLTVDDKTPAASVKRRMTRDL